uniref:Uncharacterized protein n=1 Tax=Arundo donax TaxID=35708 RepID=A0A0A9TMQ7_ARUDO
MQRVISAATPKDGSEIGKITIDHASG